MSPTKGFVLYHYDPTLVGAIIFAVLFFTSSVWHAIQIFRTRSWFFTPLLVGGLFETFGYIGRISSHFNKDALGPFIMQSVLLLVAPALFAASIYMILGRIIDLLEAEKYSVIRTKWLTKFFVAGDVLSFTIQSGGAGIMSSGSLSSMSTGQKIITSGLFLQMLFFGFFVVASLLFHKRIRNGPTDASQSLLASSTSFRTSWEGLLYALYASSTAILVRSIFRIVEYVQGNSGYLLRHEIWLYIFDGVLMLGVMVIFNLVHPSGVIPGKRRGKENADEQIEMGE